MVKKNCFELIYKNKIRYNLGHKRCTFCGIFLLQEGVRCVCCRAVLRTNPRNKKNRT